ncbi:hypothetical protein NQZ68_039801 [Dissostichus eleginoides]|nr:hypothetical protein NQZ68_039801 [Dissostichus eleginoides]
MTTGSDWTKLDLQTDDTIQCSESDIEREFRRDFYTSVEKENLLAVLCLVSVYAFVPSVSAPGGGAEE